MKNFWRALHVPERYGAMPGCHETGCKSKQKVRDRGNGLYIADEQGASADSTGRPRLIVNELLCYAFTYIDSSSPEMLMKTIEDFYTDDDIQDAKDVLWRECHSLLDNTKPRRNSCVRPATQANLVDVILKGVMFIRNSGIGCPVQFCAADIKRLPRFNPEEVNLQSIVNRLASLELHVRNNQDETAHNCARITVLEEEKNSETHVSATYASKARINTIGSSQQSSRGDQGKPTPYLTGGEQAFRSSQDKSQRSNSEILTTAGDESNSHSTKSPENKVSENDQLEWQTQRFERRKRIREAIKDSNVVIGTKSGGVSLECGYDVRNIFVFNVNKRYSESDISESMKKAGTEVIKITQISHKDATNKSFKICVKRADLITVMDPDYWGEGIKCREWVR